MVFVAVLLLVVSGFLYQGLLGGRVLLQLLILVRGCED